jgi:CHRD domain-containing protein
MKLRTLCLAAATVCALPVTAFAGAAAMHPELGAKLTGKHEVPKGSPVGHGIVNLNLKAASGKVCWTFTIVGLGKANAAHIHRAPASKAGPVVVPLGGAYKAKGCTSAPKKMIEAIESHPNAYYVNVHTAKYPNGAIRGQLVVGMVHM